MQVTYILLSLLLNSITRECDNKLQAELIIINLVFLTKTLYNSVIKYNISRKIKQFSNYLLIKTIFNL